MRGIKIASSNNILAAKKLYIELMKKKKKKKHSDFFKPIKYYIKFFGKKKEISKLEAQTLDADSVWME